MRTEHGEPLLTGFLDEGAIPSTSIFASCGLASRSSKLWFFVKLMTSRRRFAGEVSSLKGDKRSSFASYGGSLEVEADRNFFWSVSSRSLHFRIRMSVILIAASENNCFTSLIPLGYSQ